MVDNSWAFELGNTIFYVVKSRAEPILQKKFPDVYITDEGETNQKPITMHDNLAVGYGGQG